MSPPALLKAALANITAWVLTLNVSSNFVPTPWVPPTPPYSIFLNGNLARVLLTSYRVFGDEAMREEGLRWCDTLAANQTEIATSKNNVGGYWDTGYRDVYLADTGTAVVALSLGWHLAADSPARRAAYEQALRRFALFVYEGCIEAPAGGAYGQGCPPANGTGWVRADGGVGDGYYKKELNMEAYTISTANAGAAFFAHLWNVPVADRGVPPAALEAAAQGAVEWLVGTLRPDGSIPYIIFPADNVSSKDVYQPISYCAEGFVSVDALFPSPATRATLSKLNATVAFLVANQNADGSWGVEGSGDGERSPRALTLLQWWLASFEPQGSPWRAAVSTTMDRYVEFVMSNWSKYGINGDTLTTGFAALAFADLYCESQGLGWCSFAVA
jgi:hypothetical protein